MPLFEFEAGRLVPAQVGHEAGEPIDETVLNAVREQVLELLQRDLFPITWHDAPSRPRLTAMDATGQVVCVEVLDTLDAGSLVEALGRASRTAARGWFELAESYPRGVAAFRSDWNAFREQLPPSTPTGPRLHLLAARVTDDVRDAVATMEGNVLVHELDARQMSNGRTFIEVVEVRRAPVALPWVMPGRRSGSASAGRLVPGLGAPVHYDAPASVATSAASPHEATRDRGSAAPRRRRPDGARAERVDAPPAEPVTGGEQEAMAAIGRTLGEATTIMWFTNGQAQQEASFLPSGEIQLLSGEVCASPEEAAVLSGAGHGTDPWASWRFGAQGPSLAEAREELLEAGEDAGDDEPDGPAAETSEAEETVGRGSRRRRRRRRG